MEEKQVQRGVWLMHQANVILGTFTVVAVLLVYGGAYLALVERRVTFISPRAEAEYKVSGVMVRAFFWPAHAVDRLVRPKYWTVGGRLSDPYDFETFTK